jgi:hypothetical protein
MSHIENQEELTGILLEFLRRFNIQNKEYDLFNRKYRFW